MKHLLSVRNLLTREPCSTDGEILSSAGGPGKAAGLGARGGDRAVLRISVSSEKLSPCTGTNARVDRRSVSHSIGRPQGALCLRAVPFNRAFFRVFGLLWR